MVEEEGSELPERVCWAEGALGGDLGAEGIAVGWWRVVEAWVDPASVRDRPDCPYVGEEFVSVDRIC